MDRSTSLAAEACAPAPQHLVTWTEEHCRQYGFEPFWARHELHKLPLFSDEAIIALLDDYPREKLQIFTMGDDPEDRSKWQPVDTRDASGDDIMRSVAVGKLWVKLMRTDLVSNEYAELVRDVYDAIESQQPAFNGLWYRPLLLISSPGALVYYHADPQNMMLWQIRGSKRVWVYPTGRPFLEPAMMEEIFSGDADEEIPYEPSFDEAAFVHDLHPGEVLSWPLNAPHRVTNLDSVNISMSVTVGTDHADRRSQVYLANLLMRRRLGLRNLSARENGLVPFAKRTSFRIARKLGLAAMMTQRKPYLATLRINPDSPNGVSPIPGGPIQTLF
ncbi:MAG: hypothetical protein QNJ14_09275 [Woeseiaceae bacterium]|nr:hypothetical protein [Woeseiaceae bacterium]